MRTYVVARARLARMYPARPECMAQHSHEAPDTPLPDAIADGTEPFYIVGAIAGG